MSQMSKTQTVLIAILDNPFFALGNPTLNRNFLGVLRFFVAKAIQGIPAEIFPVKRSTGIIPAQYFINPQFVPVGLKKNFKPSF